MKFDGIKADSEIMKYTTDIVAAYVQGNNLDVEEISGVMDVVHAKIVDLCRAGAVVSLANKPAVPIEDSVTPDYIYCLEDGKPFKMLKKHLKTKYDMSPEEYRAKWGLPMDYPMVAPNYAIKRQALAKASGLGRNR